MASVVGVDLEVLNQVTQVNQHGVIPGLICGDQRIQLFVELPERRHPVGGGHGASPCRWWHAAIAADSFIIASQCTCGTFVSAGNDEMQWTESDHRREQWVYGGWDVGEDGFP